MVSYGLALFITAPGVVEMEMPALSPTMTHVSMTHPDRTLKTITKLITCCVLLIFLYNDDLGFYILDSMSIFLIPMYFECSGVKFVSKEIYCL